MTNVDTPRRAISQAELIALLAMLAATIAFGIDAMLPVLTDIGAELSPDTPNRAQLVIAAFVLGMGFGTLVAGPLSDAYGRRPVAVGGAVIYSGAALVAAVAPTLETILAARLVQGLGAAGPRVVAMAITRDLYSGRQMARIISFVITVFSLVPVFAPSMGAAIAWAFGWRAIFLSFAVFSVISVTWLLARQPETLAPEHRRPFRPREIWAGLTEIARTRQVVIAICIQTLIFMMLFTALMTSQPIFARTFGITDTFPIWFGAIAAVSAVGSVINAMIVVRLGMRRVVVTSLAGMFVLSGGFLLVQWIAGPTTTAAFAAYVIWQTSVFLMAGFGIGNMNAIAMEPMGHIAGMAAAIIAAVSTVFAVALAAPASIMFDGTAIPATISVGLAALAALGLTRVLQESVA